MADAPRLLHVFHSLGTGGAQTRFVRIANRFGRNLRHVAIALNGDYAVLSQIRPDIDVKVVRPSHNRDLLRRLAHYTALLRQISPDCLITHNWGTIEWALAPRGRIRHIHIEDGFGPDELNRQKLRRAMIRRLALRSSDFVVPSQVLMRIAQRSWKTSATRLHYIPNGISIAGFANRSADKIASETPVIGTVAALRPEKNLTRLLEAFASVNRQLKCELRIVGDGPQRSQLEWLAAKLEIAPSVSFCGFIADPRPQYAAFDLFALSSDTEQMPYTVLEAMASGLPVVATDVGDVKTMVSDDNASLICSRSAEALAESMLRVLKDRQFAKGVGTSNRIKVRREYDIERMYAAFAQLYGIQDGPSETVSPRV